jgi:radical SAM superfamily enzyme YgiQ (UPF0313 family)
MIKILLINPSKLSNVGFDAIPSYPLGLLYLAAVLRRAGHKVKIIDFYIYDIQYSDLNIIISKYKPDLIGLTAVSRFYNEMRRICRAITSDIPIVLGGVHPSSLPELTLRENKAKFIIIGEGEMTILELAEHIEKGGDLSKIKGLAYKNNGKIIINDPREPIENLNGLPFPAWDLLRLKSYNTALKSGYKGFFDYTEFMPIITTRGCPYKCTFCASTFFWGSSVRFRSIENIIEEIEYDIAHYNAKIFEIWDDNFTINRKRVIEFCKEIIKRKISVSFYLVNSIRLDTLTRPLIKLLKLAGFKGVAISPESGSQKIINNVNKHLDLSIVKNVATMLHQEGMNTIAFFMLGLPGETVNTAHQTVRFAASLPVNGISFFIFTPLPGSILFNKWLKERDINNIVWDTNFLGRQNYDEKIIGTFTMDQIRKFRIFGLILFITRFKNFFRWIRRFKLNRLKPIVLSARRAYLSLLINLIFKR